MDTTLYYTLSTICQTLAGAMGFLVTGAVYSLQVVEANLWDKANRARQLRKWPDDIPSRAKLQTAMAESDWAVIEDHIQTSPPIYPDADPASEAAVTNEATIAVFRKAVRKSREIKRRLTTSAITTAVTIGGCLIALSLVPLIAPAPGPATPPGATTALPWLVLIAALIGSGLSIGSYIPLIRAVVR